MTIIILGSSNSHGQTRDAIGRIILSQEIPIIDLNTLDITPFDYQHRNMHDDYFALIEQVVKHDLIVLATPVYWYSVSSTMKVFIDRLSDLLAINKDLGRKMRGKKLFCIASFDTSLPEFFEKPLELTCQYMGMEYMGSSFLYYGNDPDLKQINEGEIEKARKILEINQ